jgi:hypothetical protein
VDAQARLERAEQHIFSTGVDDAGARLALANARYGVAKIHHVQEALGLPADATFVTAPDLTVTRNQRRWRSGFGYGGAVTWGNGEDELVVLDLKANACGMIAGTLDHLPDRSDLLRRIHDLSRSDVELEGILVAWDFGNSNHFVDVFRVIAADGESFPPYAFLMHFAGDELRGDTDDGPGLYWDESVTLRRRMQVHETPFGRLRVLVGDDARDYACRFQRAESFARARRRYAADRLFDRYELLSNDTHQGLTGLNRMVLGCYTFADRDRLYPVGLRPDLPSYLVRGKPNLGCDAMERLGYAARAAEHGVERHVRGANLLPHGGGYAFPDISRVLGVHEVNGSRYFELEPCGAYGVQIVEHPADLPFEYRRREVLDRALELDMLEVAASLVPEYVLKV